MGDKMNLPFEVTYSERPAGKSRAMKRLAVLVKPEKVDAIVSALRAGGLEATIYDVKGASKEKERVASGRGMGTVDMTYTQRRIIATVVNAEDVDDVVGTMKNALGGNSGAVVMISAVDDLVRL
ncbi:MAG TPA: P-II family nitrogen regulator [Nitrososphaera sp.]|nr:P-II family nitrogen regulator [Nitrososphaera sp.]